MTDAINQALQELQERYDALLAEADKVSCAIKSLEALEPAPKKEPRIRATKVKKGTGHVSAPNAIRDHLRSTRRWYRAVALAEEIGLGSAIVSSNLVAMAKRGEVQVLRTGDKPEYAARGVELPRRKKIAQRNAAAKKVNEGLTVTTARCMEEGRRYTPTGLISMLQSHGFISRYAETGREDELAEMLLQKPEVFTHYGEGKQIQFSLKEKEKAT